MARSKGEKQGRGRGRPRKETKTNQKETGEERYVIAQKKGGSPVKARSPAREQPAVAKGRGRVSKKTALQKFNKRINDLERKIISKGSSDFDSPPARGSRQLKRTIGGRARNTVESEESEEDEEEEEEEEEESVEEEDEEEEEEQQSLRRAPAVNRRTGRTRTGDVPTRRNMAIKVQRLRTDPRFSGIKAETLSRVVEQFETDPVTPSVIINTTVCKPVPRRTRVAWTNAEVDHLRNGVATHGTSWSAILNDPNLHFQDRTQVDLKDKWRNLNPTRLYSQLPIRRFILVNENHEPILTDRGHYHVFNNRWPADAALKVATKDFVYPAGVDNVRVYLREIPSEGKEGAPLVHVFDVTRKQELATDILKFGGLRGVWVGEAKKVCTERLLTRQAVLEDIRDANRLHNY